LSSASFSTGDELWNKGKLLGQKAPLRVALEIAEQTEI